MEHIESIIVHRFAVVNEAGRIVEVKQTDPHVYRVWNKEAAQASLVDFEDTLKELANDGNRTPNSDRSDSRVRQ